MKPRDFQHDYWKNPARENIPGAYLSTHRWERSKFLASLCRDAGILPEHTILEIGCNVGRNLKVLWDSGYKRLSGIEINKAAVDLMREKFPEMDIPVRVGSIENYIRFVDNADVIISVTVLMHIHPDSEWIMGEMVQKARRWIITIEDECNHNSERILSRNYKDIFEGLGMRCIRTEREVPGMSAVYTARVFEK